MADENLTPEGTQNTEQQVEQKEYSAIELEAIEQGWIPKEEFDGDPDKFIDAPEFVRRGELFRKIETQSKELKAVRQALEAFKIHHSKVKEAEYNRALKALQDQRKQAFLDGEHERAFAIEEKIDEVKEEKQRIMEEAQQPVVEDTGYTEQFQSWVERNSWYETNDVMRAAADALGVKLHRQGNSPEVVLEKVEKAIREEFAHKFKGPKAGTSTQVEAPTRSGTKTDSFKLSAEEERIMNKIIAVTPGYTREQYIKELKATR